MLGKKIHGQVIKLVFIFICGSLGSTWLLLINSEELIFSLCYKKGGVTLIVLF